MSDFVVLLGAGASVGAHLPTALGLRNEVLRRLKRFPLMNVGSRVAKVLQQAMELYIEWPDDDHRLLFDPGPELGRPVDPDLEVLLDMLQTLAILPPSALSPAWRIVPYGDVYTIRSMVTKEVVEILLDHTDPGYLAYVQHLLSLRDPLPVFTLNHDICLEKALESAGIPFADGFDALGHWREAEYDELKSGVKLYKLHGSITWLRSDWQFPFTKASETDVLERLQKPCINMHYGYLDDHILCEYDTPHIQFGGRAKFVLEYPFTFLISELAKEVARARAIIYIGYGGWDRHVNHVTLQEVFFRHKAIIEVDPEESRVGPGKGGRPSVYEFLRTIVPFRADRHLVKGRAEDESTWREVAEIVASRS